MPNNVLENRLTFAISHVCFEKYDTLMRDAALSFHVYAF